MARVDSLLAARNITFETIVLLLRDAASHMKEADSETQGKVLLTFTASVRKLPPLQADPIEERKLRQK